jgi:hypothetical protein
MTQELILTVLSEEPDPAERAIFEGLPQDLWRKRWRCRW